MITPSHEAWIEKVSAKNAECSQPTASICRTSREDPQDESLPVLKELLERGYSKVVWNSENSNCEKCRPLNGKEWSLKDFMDATTHDAPLFSKSHPGDRSCFIIVSGDGLEDCKVGPWPTWR